MPRPDMPHSDDDPEPRCDPSIITKDHAAALLAAIRSPRVLLNVLEHGLNIYSADFDDPAQADRERPYTDGMIIALRPMLETLVEQFFALPPEERKRLRGELKEQEEYVSPEMMEVASEAPPPSPEEGDCWPDDEWRDLALSMITAPVRHDIAAIRALQTVIGSMKYRLGEITDAEIVALNFVINSPGASQLLTVLRDLRRVLK